MIRSPQCQPPPALVQESWAWSRETRIRSIRLGSGADEQTEGMRSRIHRAYKTNYGVANWASYDRVLVRRCDATLWLSREAKLAQMLMIEPVDECIEARLLLEHGGRGRSGGFGLEREVHPLVPAILLVMTRPCVRSTATSVRCPYGR
jgi:hypothetical protein